MCIYTYKDLIYNDIQTLYLHINKRIHYIYIKILRYTHGYMYVYIHKHIQKKYIKCQYLFHGKTFTLHPKNTNFHLIYTQNTPLAYL